MEMTRDEWNAYWDAMDKDDQEAIRILLQKVQDREEAEREGEK